MVSSTLLAQMFYGPAHRHGWAHPWLALVFLAFVALAIGLAVWAVFRLAGSHHPPAPPFQPPDPALEALRMRFARGEIDTDEYAARAAHLIGGPPPPAAPPAAPTPTA